MTLPLPLLTGWPYLPSPPPIDRWPNPNSPSTPERAHERWTVEGPGRKDDLSLSTQPLPTLAGSCLAWSASLGRGPMSVLPSDVNGRLSCFFPVVLRQMHTYISWALSYGILEAFPLYVFSFMNLSFNSNTCISNNHQSKPRHILWRN